MPTGRNSIFLGVVLSVVLGCYESAADAGDGEAVVAPDAEAVDSGIEDGIGESVDCCDEVDDGPPEGEDESTLDTDDAVDDAIGDADGDIDVATCPDGMAFVPAGSFVMGADPGEALVDNETPEHVVDLSAYCIDIDETTEAEYEACVDAAICASRPYSDGDPELPRRAVKWSDAWAYCAWNGKRLPTEAEWEKAGRGGCEVQDPPSCGAEDERIYPWGDAPPVAGMTNICFDWVDRWECDYRARRGPVGSWADDTSPYGVRDMLGNVWEWVADWYDAAAYETCGDGCVDPLGPATGDTKVLRGSQCATLPAEAALTRRGGWFPDFAEDVTEAGIRCAFTPEP